MNGKLKERILRRDDYRCRYCGATSMLTIDHIFPRSRGGHPDKKENLVTSCFRCNQSKANMTPEEWGTAIDDVGYRPRGKMVDNNTELSKLMTVNHRRMGRKKRRKLRREYKKALIRDLDLVSS